jgi:ABC-type arginine transport system ATPase subunit
MATPRSLYQRMRRGTKGAQTFVLQAGHGRLDAWYTSGVVFDSYAIWPHMTVAENLAYTLKVRNVAQSGSREQVVRLLDCGASR